jgi:hypothetical protein
VTAGRAYQVSPATDVPLLSKGQIRLTANRVYRVTAEVRQLTKPTNNSKNVFTIGLWGLDANFNALAYSGVAAAVTGFVASPASVAVADGWIKVAADVTIATANAATWGRTYLKIAANAGSVVQVMSLTIEDVTESQRAKGSADAAAVSASNASASDTAAGLKASAALTSATAAETSKQGAVDASGAASISAGKASTSASQASSSETNALGSASAAGTSATNAANSAIAAGNSAGAAATSASTAGTKATDSGNSATAANTSALNAQSSFTNAALVVSKLFPDRYDATGQLYFTSTPIGDPKTVTDAPSNATASGYGSVREMVAAGATTLEFGSRNVLPATAGKIYRIEVELQRTALTATTATVSLMLLGMNSSYASLGTVGTTITLTGSVQTATFMFSNASSANITAWTASSVWLRPFVRVVGVTGSNSTTIQVRRLTVTDVTSEMAATNSATAAALSASNASTQSDAAGASATSATTSANTATSQAGTATTQAGIATTKAADAGTAATNAGLAATSAQGIANNLLPDRPSIRSNFAATTAAPSPETVTPIAVGTIVAVTNEGDVLQYNAPTYVITRGWIGITAARTYQQDIRWRVTADGSGSVTGSWFLYNSAGTYLGAVSLPFDSSLTSAEGWRTFTNQATSASLLAAYPTAAYVRAGAYFNTSVVWQTNILRLRDVTDTVIAQNAASAASLSASNADTSATAAGQSATASNTQATNAATSATAAKGSQDAAKGSADTALGAAVDAGTFSGQAGTYASNASKSASDALGSANTATIQAGVASTSVGTVVNTINTAPILPADFRNGLASWTNARTGSPTAIAPAALTYAPGTSIVTNDTDFGSAYESNWSTAGQNILPIGVITATIGRIYEIVIRFKVTVLPTDTTAQFHIVAYGMLADYSQATTPATSSTPVNVTTTGVTELRVKISDTVTGGAEMAWGSDTRFFRPALRLNTSESGMTIRIGSIQVIDVTEKLASQAAATLATNQATAAAGSASTAGTAVTNAGNSATAANTSAVNAASAYNATVATAANLFPERLDATGSTFYYTTSAVLTAGSPTAISMATGDQTKIITETNYGLVYNFSGLTGYFANRGAVPAVAARVYEVTYEFNLSVYGSTPFVPKIALEGMTTTYTDLGMASVTLPTVSAVGVVSGSVRFSNAAATGITAWPTNSVWLRPVFYGSGGTGSTIYIRRMTIKDITSVVSAEFQATAAAASASTASTQAGLAGGSATSATTSANTATSQAGTATTQAGIATTKAGDATTQAGIATTKAGEATTQAGIATTQAGNAGTSATTAGAAAAAAQIVANALIPDRPSLKANFVSTIGAGTPDAATPLTLGTVVTVTNEGDVLQNNAIGYVITRGWIGITAARTYQMDARWAVTADGAGAVTGSWFLYSATGAYLGAVSIPYDSTLTVAEGFRTFSNQTTTTALLAAYSGAAYVRAGIYFNTSLTWQVNILRLRDVTDAVTAVNAASAASLSASNADTSATAAGQSATASNLSATNAATSAAGALSSEGKANTYQGQAGTFASNASKSASDSLGSANTATTQAGVASTSVGIIQVAAAALLPERFDNATATFTNSAAGSPSSVTPLSASGFVSASGYGTVYQATTTTSTVYDIYTVGTVPFVAGRFYAVEAELNAVTIASGETATSVAAQILASRLDGSYATSITGQSYTYLTDNTVKVSSGLWSFGAASSGYQPLGGTGVVYVRFGVRINSTKAGNVVQFRRLRVVDVTSQVLANQSATAAAGSASTAGTAVTNAGNSATAANTSAATAASASNASLANAAYTFPGRFPTDAQFWVTNDQAPTATGSLISSAAAYTATATGFQWNRALSGTYQELRTRGWVPVTGVAQYFRVDIRARVITPPDDATSMVINVGMRGGDTSFIYSGWSNQIQTQAFTTDWTTQSVTTTDASFLGSTTTVQSHVCIQLGKNVATTGIIEIASVTITNVTSERAAGLSATAAATSASTASTQAGLAGASSTSATTSANTATSQAGIATTKAGDATTQAGIATTKAGDATTQAGIATTKAGEATTQAGIATGKAADATTQASLALNYAATATDAAVAAQTVANLLIPDRPSIRSNFVSTTAAGTPTASTALTFGTVVAVPVEGDVLQHNNVAYVINRGWLPITTARTYQQDIRWAPLADGAGSVTGSWFVYDASGAYLGPIDIPFDSSITVAEGWRTFTNTVTSTTLLAAYATAAYVRAGVYFNTTLVWQVSMVRVRDVTELVAAQNAATAASTSASNADTSATLAGQSATASNTQATNAATSATAAKGSQDAAKLSQDAALGSAGDASTFSGQAGTFASNASKSASDALGSANTATTQAGVSSASANQATLTVAASFPSDFSQNGRFFVNSVTGDPATRTPIADSKFTTIANVGQVYVATAGDILATRSVVKAVVGRTYEFEISVKVMSANTAGGNAYIMPQIVGLNSDYSEGGSGGFYSAVAVSGFASTDNNRAIDTDFAVFKVRHTHTNVNTAWIRPRLVLNYNGGSGATGNQTIYVRYMRFSDVTDIVAAANSATAAAGSASTAGTKATDAGNSATAANTSAVNAASSMSGAQQAALFTNPKTFEQDALYFVGDTGSIAPGNISFVTISNTRYAQNTSTGSYGYISWKSAVPHTAGRSYRITAKVLLASGDVTKNVGVRIATYNTQLLGTRASLQTQEQTLTTVGTLVSVVKEFLVADGSPWVRPELIINYNGTGAAVHQVLSLEMLDITSEKAAAGSATAAAGFASTAGTSADAAGNSATGANTSAVNAASSLTSVNLTAAQTLPSDFMLDGRFFQQNFGGDPATRVPLGSGSGKYSFATVTGIGRVLQVSTSTATTDFSSIGMTNVIAGRKYRVTASVRLTADAVGTVSVNLFALGNNATYSNTNNAVSTLVPTTSWQTMTTLATADTLIANGVTYIQPMARSNATAANVFQWAFLKLEDITESTNAAGSATAAAGSASTADTRATAAGNSATSANTSAVNAASSFTAANNAARALFPDLINNTAQVFAYTENGSGPPSAFVPIPAAQYVTDPDLGVCFERPWTTSPAGVGFIDAIPFVAGRIYQMEVQGKLVSSTFTSVNLSPNMRPLAADYTATGVTSNVQIYAAMAMTVGAVKTVKWLFGLGDGVVPVSSDNTVGRTTHAGATVWLRPYMRVEATGTGTGVVRFSRITITDVTTAQAASNSATAAAGSASTAGTKADAAGNSATAANTSAANAASSLTATLNTALRTIPKDFAQSGQFYTMTSPGPSAPSIPDANFRTVTGVGTVLFFTGVGGYFPKSKGYLPNVAARVYRITAVVRALTANIAIRLQNLIVTETFSYGNGVNSPANITITPAQSWQTVTLEVTGDGATAYYAPQITYSGSDATSVMEVRTLTMDDVTSERSALNAATAAAGSASTADTRATDAGNSATAANTSAVNATSSYNAVNQTVISSIPSDFSLDGRFYSYAYTGAPTRSAINSGTGEYSFVTTTDYGRVLQVNATGTNRDVSSLGAVNVVAGRKYRLTTSVRTVATPTGVVLAQLAYIGMGADYASVSNKAVQITPTTTWQVMTLDMDGTELVAAGAILARPRVRTNGTVSTDSVQYAYLKIEDITIQTLAQQSATAAALSATTADTRATDSGNSATIANTNALAAASSFTATQNVVLYTNPTTFEQDGLYFAGDNGAIAPSGIFVADSSGRLFQNPFTTGSSFIQWKAGVPHTPGATYRITAVVRVPAFASGQTSATVQIRCNVYTAQVGGTRIFNPTFNANITDLNTFVTIQNDFVMPGNAGMFIVPEALLNFPTANTIVQLQSLKMTDVTVQVAALGSANAANTSAGTAGTKADAAGTSADAANTSKLAAQAAQQTTQTAAIALFPERLDNLVPAFTASAVGGQTQVPALPASSFVTASGYGTVFQSTAPTNSTSGFIDIGPVALLPFVTGRFYRVEWEAQVTVIGSGDTIQSYAFPRLMDASFAQVSSGFTSPIVNVTTTDVLTTSATFGCNVGGGDVNINQTGVTWIRPMVRFFHNGKGSVFQYRRIKITDVTTQMQAASSASAANISAGTANTRATDSGNSAIAANTSALNAASSFGSTNLLAAKALPDRLDGTGDYFGGITGDPKTVSAITAVGSVVNVSGYGLVWQTPAYTATSYRDVATRQVVPGTAGRIYKVEAEYQITNLAAGDSFIVQLAVRTLDATYAGGALNFAATSGVTATTVQTISGTVFSSGGPSGYNYGTPTFLRFYVRFNNAAFAGSVVQFRRLTVTDITESYNANLSAVAANTSAGTATTKADAASTSADAANTSKLAAASSYTATAAAAVALLPERMDNSAPAWSNIRTGIPSSITPFANSFYVNVAGYGNVIQFNTVTTAQFGIDQIGVVPFVQGRYYRVEYEYQVTAMDTGAPIMQSIVVPMTGTFALNGASPFFATNFAVPDLTVQTKTLVFGCNVAGGDYNINTAGTVWLRFEGKCFNSVTTGTTTWQFRRMKVTDVTSEINAGKSASAAQIAQSAASNSASDAAKSYSDAQGSASDASTSKNLAASSALQARTIATQIFPSDFSQDGVFFTNAVASQTPADITVGTFVNYADTSFVFRGGFLPSGATLTRTTVGSRTNETGTLVSEAINVARFENVNGPAWTVGGLLVEPATTNFVRNSTAAGAAVNVAPNLWTISGSANGITRTIVGTGVQNGINYVDVRFAGTSTATSSVQIMPDNLITAATGDVWTGSMFVSLVGGTDPGATLLLVLSENNSTGGFIVATSRALGLTTTLTRQSITRTFNNASTVRANCYIQLSTTSGTAYDVTIRVGLPQMEKGSAMTSPIMTSTGSLARGADVSTLNWASLGINDGTFTVRYTFDNGTMQDVSTTVSGGVSTIPTNLNRLIIRRADKI